MNLFVSFHSITFIKVYNLEYYGFVNFVCFNAILLMGIFKLIRKRYLVSLGLICVYIAFVVDASFNFTPALINYFCTLQLSLKLFSFLASLFLAHNTCFAVFLVFLFAASCSLQLFSFLFL